MPKTNSEKCKYYLIQIASETPASYGTKTSGSVISESFSNILQEISWKALCYFEQIPVQLIRSVAWRVF